MHKPDKQSCSQVLRFGGWQNTFSGEQDFVFIICVNGIYLGTTKFEGGKKMGRTASEFPPSGYGPSDKLTCMMTRLRTTY